MANHGTRASPARIVAAAPVKKRNAKIKAAKTLSGVDPGGGNF